MAVLTLKSENQILAAMIAKFLSETGINDMNPASIVRTMLEAAAMEDFNQYVQMLNIIRNYNLDTTTGSDLDTRGFEFGLTRNDARKATGLITILRPSSFVKVSSSMYSGLPAPIAGDTKLRVNDASNLLYGTSGTLIVGRGTSNEEEVTYSVAPVNFTNYWEFTTSPFSNDHGVDESVILKQGSDESIVAGTLVSVPASSTSPEIQFSIDEDTTLLAGEDKVESVAVTCTQTGIVGNIPIQAISGETAFPSPPFTGARAQNDAKFTTGRDREIDDDFRNRIKNHIQSLSRGTKTAILNAVIGLVDPDTAKRVVSANLILPDTLEEPVRIYIDDGTGFEPSYRSLGFEAIIDQSTGGEDRIQLDLAPLVKAQVENNFLEPYNMSAGALTFIFSVGLVSETITFSPGDFAFPASATAEEIAAAINDKATLIEARTSQSGKKVVIQARADENEDIQVTGGTSNPVLGFPTDSKSTLYLYIDDILQSKDGSTAFVDAGTQETYNFSSLGAAPWPLNVVVDGKSANPQVVNFVAADFSDPSAASADEVVAAINARLAGATAILVNNGTKPRIISNTELSSLSKIQVTGGSANTLLNFSTSEVVGRDRDYVLNRELGTIELSNPLSSNQSVTAGSLFTRARHRTASPEFYAITAGQTLVVKVDGGSDQTVTFASTGVFSAAQIAALINAQLQGATAIVRNIGGLNYVEINTNTYTQASGSLEIQPTSTATSLNFPYDVIATNQRPHRAFVASTGAAPFAFVIGHNLVVILDSDPASKTFTVIFDYDGTVTTGTSTTVFSNLAFNTVFPNNDQLKDYYVVFQAGPNSTTGTVDNVTNPGGSTFRYNFASLPANLASFAIGDHVAFSNMTQASNNGSFIITGISTAGNGYVEVTNTSGVVESGSSGSALIGARRQVLSHVGATGQITLASALPFTPVAGNSFSVLPSTLKNTVEFFNNTKVSTISTKAFIEASDNNTKVQISSKSNGSDGYVQVTGGSANALLGFSTSIFRGLQGYNYYTGLLALVHKTIYGDDTDLVSFPGVGAAGIQFQILAPTVKELSFNVDVTLSEGVSISNVEDDIKSAITGYVNSRGVGEDVILSELIAAIMEVDNVTDVVFATPTANTPVADNEIARTRDSLITVG